MLSPPLSTSIRPAVGHDDNLLTLLKERHLCIAANRGPVHYHLRGDRIEPAQAAGGLVTALSDVAVQVPLTWIASATGPGDRLAAHRSTRRVASPGSPKLRYVVTSEEAFNWHYRRFSNPILWFLQHGLRDQLRRPNLTGMIEHGWMLGYRPVNEAFARVVEEEIRRVPRPVVQIHDYHLYLLPALLRKRVPGALLQHFTHIPWPSPDSWEMLLPPIRRDICRGLLGADICGFQTEASALNFLRCCERFLPGARVDYPRHLMWLEGHATRVRVYPISIDPASLRRLATARETVQHKTRIKQLSTWGTGGTVVRVDRLDPSKNIALGFRAFGLLLQRRPDLLGRTQFLAFLVPTRQSIAEYRRYAQEVWREVEAVNARFGRQDWKPIHVFYEDNRPQAAAGMALADVLLVNSVADGMNLVAKEGPTINERDAVLVLSETCGAHGQLGRAALSVPPLSLEATATALERAIEMPAAERKRRATALQAAVESEDLSWWVRQQLDDLLGC